MTPAARTEGPAKNVAAFVIGSMIAMGLIALVVVGVLYAGHHIFGRHISTPGDRNFNPCASTAFDPAHLGGKCRT